MLIKLNDDRKSLKSSTVRNTIKQPIQYHRYSSLHDIQLDPKHRNSTFWLMVTQASNQLSIEKKNSGKCEEHCKTTK